MVGLVASETGFELNGEVNTDDLYDRLRVSRKYYRQANWVYVLRTWLFFLLRLVASWGFGKLIVWEVDLQYRTYACGYFNMMSLGFNIYSIV